MAIITLSQLDVSDLCLMNDNADCNGIIAFVSTEADDNNALIITRMTS